MTEHTKMDIQSFEQWVHQFYASRQWSDYDSFIRVGFLMEEVGEVARAVRAMEIGRDRPDEAVPSDSMLHQELVEELGDVLANLLVLAKRYDISMDRMMQAHQDKLINRFGSI